MRYEGDNMGRELIMHFATVDERQEWEMYHAGYSPQVTWDESDEYELPVGGLYKWFGCGSFGGDNRAKPYGRDKGNYY